MAGEHAFGFVPPAVLLNSGQLNSTFSPGSLGASGKARGAPGAMALGTALDRRCVGELSPGRWLEYVDP